MGLCWICALGCFGFARAKFWLQYSTLVSAAVMQTCWPITALLFCDRPMRSCELLAEAGWRLLSAWLLLYTVLFVLALGIKAQLFETLAVSFLFNGSVFMHTTFRRERVAVSRCGDYVLFRIWSNQYAVYVSHCGMIKPNGAIVVAVKLEEKIIPWSWHRFLR